MGSSPSPRTTEFVRNHIWPIVAFCLAVVLLAVSGIVIYAIKQQVTLTPVDDILRLMPAFITMMFGAVGLYIIMTPKYGPKDKHWAYATLGTILGYWLKH